MTNKKDFSLLKIVLISCVGVFFLLIGLVVYFADSYSNLIYISKNIVLEKAINISNQYRITGEITNRTKDSIVIEKIEIRAYPADRSVYGVYELTNIAIDAGETYNILAEITSVGDVEYTFVSLYKCVVDDTHMTLKYSNNGKSFGNQQNEITAIIAGLIFIGIDVILINKFIKKRRVQNGK